MEKLSAEKFQALSNEEMASIEGAWGYVTVGVSTFMFNDARVTRVYSVKTNIFGHEIDGTGTWNDHCDN